MRVLAFGEILWDMIEGEAHLGGAPFNFAAHSARCGNEAFIISRLGNDKLGVEAFEMCQLHGVNNSFVQLDNKYPTGIVDVTLNNGQPDYVIREDAAFDFITFNEIIPTLDEHDFDVFYFGSLAQRNHVSFNTLHAVLKKIKIPHVFYDVNLRKSCDEPGIIRNSLSVCNILKLNTDELPRISRIICREDLSYDQFCRRLVQLYPALSIIIITAAEKGCYVFVEDRLHYIYGVPVEVEDAIGAGDAFSAVFMHIFLQSTDAVKAAGIANNVGAYVATQRGAVPEYTAEIKALL